MSFYLRAKPRERAKPRFLVLKVENEISHVAQKTYIERQKKTQNSYEHLRTLIKTYKDLRKPLITLTNGPFRNSL